MTQLLPDAPNTDPTHAVNGVEVRAGGASKGKGKKRARGYEGDEILRSSTAGSLLDAHQSEEVLVALDGTCRASILIRANCYRGLSTCALQL